MSNSRIDKLLKEIENRTAWGSIRNFGSSKVGSGLGNKRGDSVVSMLDDAGYYTIMVNGNTVLTGKAGG